ncbi:MAG: 50S ribosomal protein L23 [Candidatus Moranbacteria bacterium GW2011_GWC1_45_18]|nr:MAG: 50S ribosomal protein L23 [Candidatus Moranbacteria bacterium GW2011_GWC2_40_12]KKT32128.1 MAG: 50S ribosomal protein L23 [Candidatus Moranbacteria bacterium GW2011_GWF2_44_10]KKT99769.1 MAG: 50S ribosomal protein L23 [Candidatus Moranbacteria bacterium GW2011_GWC1_45_18]HBB36598.1 50S ribosomal protein L23 [Candidatus Moranbacteria bacterium]HBU25365.1 50S ribosomal protein L23 [Candidatus Moranbacteria bacterium]
MAIFDRILGKKGTEKETVEKGNKPKAIKVAKKEKTREKPVNKAKTEKPKKEVKSGKVLKKEENIAHRILSEPLVTEKSASLGQFNKYVFKVAQKADKRQIKGAIQDYYGVRVTSVNIIRIHPKKRVQGRTVGYKKGYKKAIVTLATGDTIGINESV